jgi:hypothetical protein
MKNYLIPIFLLLFSWTAHAGTLDTIDALEAAPDEGDKMLIRDSATDKSITTLYLMRMLEAGLTDYEIHADNLAASGVPAQSNCNTITSGLCLDTDDGYLYSWDGDSVGLVGVLNFLPLTGGILTNTLYIDDGDTHSPRVILTDETDEIFALYKYDGGSLIVETTAGTDRNLVMQNYGAGNLNLVVDGTIAATATDGGVLLGSGTGAFTPMAVLEDGEMIVGDGTTDPVAESGATLRTSIGLDQGVNTDDAVVFITVNTGPGATEVHLMDQDVKEADDVIFASVTADLYRDCHASDAFGPTVGQDYCADGESWDPSSSGLVIPHIVNYSDDDPSDVYVLIRDSEGNSYYSGILVGTTAATGDRSLTTAEMSGGIIYVTSASTLTMLAVFDGASFTVITIGATAVSIDANASDKILRDGTLQDDGDKITNLSTTGDMAVCTYYSADGWYCASNGWTDGG